MTRPYSSTFPERLADHQLRTVGEECGMRSAASPFEGVAAVEIVAPDRYSAVLLQDYAAPFFPGEIVGAAGWVVRFHPSRRDQDDWVVELLTLVERWLRAVPLPCARVLHDGRSYLMRTPPAGVSLAPPGAPADRMNAESRRWLVRLHGVGRARDRAIVELHEQLRREASFHIRLRARAIPGFPVSDVDDLAVESANDALLAVLRKLDEFRGESQFWTWAKRFAQLEAPVSIRRRLGRDRLADDPEWVFACPDRSGSPQERAEVQELVRMVSELITGQLTARQRAVLVAVAIDGVSPATLAVELDSTPGAIYKTLHDARRKLTAQLVLG